MEDLNFLYLRQQQERSRAEDASCPRSREAHERLAECYESRIRAYRTVGSADGGQGLADYVPASLRAVERSRELLNMPYSKVWG